MFTDLHVDTEVKPLWQKVFLIRSRQENLKDFNGNTHEMPLQTITSWVLVAWPFWYPTPTHKIWQNRVSQKKTRRIDS